MTKYVFWLGQFPLAFLYYDQSLTDMCIWREPASVFFKQSDLFIIKKADLNEQTEKIYNAVFLVQCNLAFQFYTISCTFTHINVDAQPDLSLLSVKNHSSIIQNITLEFFLI